MVSNDIQHWLTIGGSFADGLELLERCGNTAAKRILSQYLRFHFVPATAMDQLTQALRAYLIQNPAAELTQPAEPARKKSTDSETLPTAVQQLYSKAKSLLKERDAHRAQLLMMVDHADQYGDQDRYLQADAIMEIQEEIDELYQRIEAYQETGTIPEQDIRQQVVRDTVDKMNRINSLRSAISRLQKRVAKLPEGHERTQLETELLAKQVERKELEEELGISE